MIAIVDCCGHNIASVCFALERIGYQSVLTHDPNVLNSASHVILPGVGHAGYAMSRLHDSKLIDVIRSLTQPVLGICLGMQLLYQRSEEGKTVCLGIISGEVKALAHRVLSEKDCRVIPHMGWNTLSLPKQPYVYFVHSFCAPVNQWTVACTKYGVQFTSMVRYKNFWGMQFHPERSGSVGEKLLINFLGQTPHQYL